MSGGLVVTQTMFTKWHPAIHIPSLTRVPQLPMPAFVSIKAVDGLFFSALGGGGDQVLASKAGAATQFETFQIYGGSGSSGIPRNGDKITIRAADGRYVQADLAHGGRLQATAADPGGWEQFVAEEIAPGAGIQIGGAIALRSSANNQYICAEGGGGGMIAANRNARGPWETFTIDRMTTGPRHYPTWMVVANDWTTGHHQISDGAIDLVTGQVRLRTHAWSGWSSGFHCCANIAGLDTECFPVWVSSDVNCGVDGVGVGTNDRTEGLPLNTIIPEDMRPKITAVLVTNRLTPHESFLDWLANQGKTAIETAAKKI